MNILMKPTNNMRPSVDTPVLNVQRACLLLLGSVMVVPAYAASGSHTSPGAQLPTVLLAQVVINRDPWAGSPPQGDGVINAQPARPPSPQSLPPTPAAPPAASAPPKPPVVKPGVEGPEKPIPQGAGPAMPTAASNSVLPPEPPRISMPSGPTQGATPTPEARVANSAIPPANTNVGPVLTLAPNMTDKPPSAHNPPGGRGPELLPNLVNQPPAANDVNPAKPPTKPGVLQGSSTSVSAVNTNANRLGGGLGEILPSSQKLSESMHEQAASAKIINSSVAAPSVQSKCTPVSLRPDPRRSLVSLVDLLGDGLIVAAVPDAHIQSVFARAGYGGVDLSKAARWCVTPTAARELLQPVRGTGGQDASLLVRTGAGLQLMSQDQWLAHQASLKPLVASMSAKSAKAGRLAKASNRTLAKPTAKSSAGITVGALRLPTGANKATGTAS